MFIKIHFKSNDLYRGDLDPSLSIHKVYAKLEIGSTTYYLVKSLRENNSAPNPYGFPNLIYVHDSIPSLPTPRDRSRDDSLRGYYYISVGAIEVIHYEDNMDAADEVLHDFEDKELERSWES